MSRRVQFPHVLSLLLPLPLSFVVPFQHILTLFRPLRPGMPASLVQTRQYLHQKDGVLIPKQVGVKACVSSTSLDPTASDEARDGCTFIIITPDALATIQPDSPHIAA